MAKPSPSRLGRGLSGLLAGGGAKAPAAAPGAVAAGVEGAAGAGARTVPPGARVAPGGDLEVPVASVVPNPYQPRKEFSAERLQELAESIRSEGLLQPIVVRPVEASKFELVAGERRWRAFQLLGLKFIPARVVEAKTATSAAAALIENLQREDLNPLEEAQGYASLLKDFDLTQEAVAERVGKGRATVANALRLLSLSREIQGLVVTGHLTAGHAKVLLGLEDDADRMVVARRIVEEGLSVRAAEKLVNGFRKAVPGAAGSRGRARVASSADQAAIVDIERRLTSHLQARVALVHSPRKGKVVITYQGNAELQRILEKLGVPT